VPSENFFRTTEGESEEKSADIRNNARILITTKTRTAAYISYGQFGIRELLQDNRGLMIEQCFTSSPTQYRLYGRRFLRVKRPNQQYQSTEGDATKDKSNNENNKIHILEGDSEEKSREWSR